MADLLELKAKRNLIERKQVKYEHDNCIEFFGVVNKERAWVHSADNPDSLCKCNLFKGANPKQKELLTVWLNPQYKVFTLTGSNKFGKTTAGTVIAVSSMIGYFPWDAERQ